VDTNFDLAPPPKTVAGRTAVPIDISTIEARLRLDGTTRAASADTTLRFEVGPSAGCPIFDLRQTVTDAWLDGTSFPVEQILTADLGGGPGAQLRMLDTVLPAHSRHTLRLTYPLAAPQSPAGGSYPPAIEWSDGPRLRFNFGFTDLAAARYLEAWIPANLIWDQYAMTLDVEVTGTPVAHRPITNGTVTVHGTNHWSITFPARFTALSPLLEVRAEDTLASASTAVVLAGRERPVTAEVIKRRSDPVDLAATLTDLSSWLRDNAEAIGRYIHGDRFTAFLIQGGMEYEGACTATTGTLRHEAFHSWWGRGVKPASQADGWWDEGWNVYHDNGATATRAFDFAEPPRVLSVRNRYSRVTPTTAYTDGERFFEGVAAQLSPDALASIMNQFYRGHLDRPTTTEALEAHLVSRSGAAELVDAFHRWVYGFADPAPTPALVFSAGDAPQLWVRHHNDNGSEHQVPRAGHVNWVCAQVANRGSGTAEHFVVTFQIAKSSGPDLAWPRDFLPSTTAAVGFDLPAGQSRVVAAALPAHVWPPGHGPVRLLASVLTRGAAAVTAVRRLRRP
jgi:hypothetical protein